MSENKVSIEGSKLKAENDAIGCKPHSIESTKGPRSYLNS